MKRYYLACLIPAIIALTGCQEPAAKSDTGFVHQFRVQPIQYYSLGPSIEGRPIPCYVLGNGPDTVYYLAAIHGSEPAGTPLLWRLLTYLRQNPDMLDGRTVVIMPTGNPDGKSRGERYNSMGVDLNRNFATANRVDKRRFGKTALSEPESRAIEEVITKYKPDRVITIHQPLSCIDYDGPGGSLARHMGQYSDLPVKKLGASPGSLGSYSGETLGIPTVTVELPKDATSLNPYQLWQNYSPMLIAALTYPDKPEPKTELGE